MSKLAEYAEEAGITIAEPQAVTTTEEIEGVSGVIMPTDIVLPYMHIVQPTSQEGTKGMLMFTSGIEKPVVELVVLHIALTRTFMVTGQGLACSSADRTTGRPRKHALIDPDMSEEVTRLDCAMCPRYMDDQFGKDTCQQDYALTCYDLDDNEAFLWRVRGSAQKEVRAKALNPVLSGRKKPWFAQFTVSTEKMSNAKGTWFEPRLRPTLFNAEQVTEWSTFARSFGVAKHDAFDDSLPFE